MALSGRPHGKLAKRAGLLVDNGVVVDEFLRASHPDVFAVGDVANAEHRTLGRRLRVEHWATALHHGEAVAAAVIGAPEPYDRLPYFFSDQYDIGLEYLGFVPRGLPQKVVLRGDPDSGEFVAFWTRDGLVAAGLAVNSWGLMADLEALIRARAPVSAAALSDPGMPLTALVPGS